MSGARARKCINLTDSSLSQAFGRDDEPFTFGIFYASRFHRDHIMRAASEKQMMQWLDAMHKALGVHRENVSIHDFEMMMLVGKGAYGSVRRGVGWEGERMLSKVFFSVLGGGGGSSERGTEEKGFSIDFHFRISSSHFTHLTPLPAYIHIFSQYIFLFCESSRCMNRIFCLAGDPSAAQEVRDDLCVESS